MQLKPLIIFVSSIAISWAASIEEVLSDINAIQNGLGMLDNAIKGFTNSLAGALEIHTIATNVQSEIEAATSDVETLPTVTESDGQIVLNAVQGLEPAIISTLDDIVDKKPAFVALPIGGIPALVLQDLENLSASTVTFENALISKSPNDLIVPGEEIANNVNAAFATAIAAYSS